ncbi:LysR family transcriptional regulator [Bacillus sp. 03113]|uniref:LysR family transcriptional regulator n=1 Tax=Bacillus sp. 03113 TaxID=2578211 RepID=UPI001142BEFF|nr:LysR family transcriptional regulator [Bacillus sp. 03113]
MESHDLWIFKHVAELQSISKAAERLGYVQPNITQRIKGLEDELSVKLFTRNNRGVTLTEHGEILLEYTNQIIMLMDEVKAKISPNQGKETLTIGASQTISAVKVPQLFSSFLKTNKDVNVKIRTNDNRKLQEMLSYGELDGIFLSGSYNPAIFESVYHYFESMILISPITIKMMKIKDATLLVNSDKSCVYRNTLIDLWKKNIFYEPSIMEFDSLESILQAVQEGLGVSILPSDVIHNRKQMKTMHFQELQDKIKIDFVIRHRKQQPHRLKKFILFLHNQ